MIKTTLCLSAVAALALAGGCASDNRSANVTTYDESSSYAYQPAKQKQVDPAAMASKMEELGKVGSKHGIINNFVGSWTCQTKIWCPMQTEPIETQGTMNVRALHDGRFVQADYKGNVPFPGPDGKPKDTAFTGTKVWGYSNADNEYQAIWTDSMSTGMCYMTGAADSDGNVVTLTGTCKGPDEAGNVVTHTNTEKLKRISGDKYVSELWCECSGKPKQKVMEITYTRATGTNQTQP